jgi:antitoxin (DNA-binding transcriptional repressor) of toxin-antitoxin stability system
MDRVTERRETFIITKRGRPVAKLTPLDPKIKESLFGCFRNKVKIVGNIIEPVLSQNALETVEEWDALIGRGPRMNNARTKRRRRPRRRA